MFNTENGESLSSLKSVQSALNEYVLQTGNSETEIENYHSALTQIVNKMEKSDVSYTYASEVVDKCVKLISLKEMERALIEYKFLVENLKKEFGL